MDWPTPESRLKRFLHYGSEERFYFPRRNAKLKFRPEHVPSVTELILRDDTRPKIVNMIVEAYEGNLSVEPLACLYALALVARYSRKLFEEEEVDDGTKTKIPKKIEKSLCKQLEHIIRDAYRAARRISVGKGEYFLTFTYYLREIAKTQNKKGFGGGWRKTVERWYQAGNIISVALEVTKFRSDTPWTHKKIMDLSRSKSVNPAVTALMTYVRKGYKVLLEKFKKDTSNEVRNVLTFLEHAEHLKRAVDDVTFLEALKKYNFSLEHCSDKFLKNPEVWLTVIPGMSTATLLSKLTKMSRMKLFSNREIITAVTNKFGVSGKKVHPIHVYVVRKSYEEGPKLIVDLKYINEKKEILEENNGANCENILKYLQKQPPPRRIPQLLESLHTLLYRSIQELTPTGLRYLIALDLEAAVESKKCSFERFVSVEEAALLVALCVIRGEKSQDRTKLVTFINKPTEIISVIPVDVLGETMNTLKTKIKRDNSANINIQNLIKWATETKEYFDIILVLGDNNLNPKGAHYSLKKYQEQFSLNTKLITCCFVGQHKKVKSLTKSDMFLICGFDKNVGRLIEACSRNAF